VGLGVEASGELDVAQGRPVSVDWEWQHGDAGGSRLHLALDEAMIDLACARLGLGRRKQDATRRRCRSTGRGDAVTRGRTKLHLECSIPLALPLSPFPFLVQNLDSPALFTIPAPLCFTDPHRRLIAKIDRISRGSIGGIYRSVYQLN
jgi:hypothetical protein